MAELESGGEMTRYEVAEFLREFADELEGGRLHDDRGDRVDVDVDRDDDRVVRERRRRDDDRTDREATEHVDAERITLIVGGNSATVTVPEFVDFDVEVDSRSPMLSSGVKQEIEFEMAWELEDVDQYEEESIEVE